MNFMSREEISMIASVSDLWQTCDGWCSNRCVENLGSVIWQLQIGHSFSPKVGRLRDLSTDCTHLVPFTPYSRASLTLSAHARRGLMSQSITAP